MEFGFITKEDIALCTDLYELTMAQSYLENGKTGVAVFDLFIRQLPKDRAFLISAGIEQALYYILNLKFSKDAIDYLRSTGIFKDILLDWLSEYRFSGDVWGIEEGELVFENEPVLEVIAPIPEAQILETALLNIINYQMMIATKAVRSVISARGRMCIDFGLRRAQGFDAGLKAARASYIGGFSATSNVLAGKVFGIPITGTMAHSYITVFQQEEDAFTAFSLSFPDRTIFLIDTYNTIEGAKKAVKVAKKLEEKGIKIKGVRIDSGDLVELSKEVRKILDQAGLNDVIIVGSGGLDEYKIEELLENGAKIDAFGIGTEFITSSDAPYLEIIYKLVEYDGRPVYKLSPGKKTLPGKKQVYRKRWEYDYIALREEEVKEGSPLIKKFIENGKLIYNTPTLKEIREKTLENINSLPDKYKKLRNPEPFPVKISEKIKSLVND